MFCGSTNFIIIGLAMQKVSTKSYVLWLSFCLSVITERHFQVIKCEHRVLYSHYSISPLMGKVIFYCIVVSREPCTQGIESQENRFLDLQVSQCTEEDK